MHQFTLCATLRQLPGNAAMLGLLLVMPFAVPQAHAAPDQVHLGRQPQAQIQTQPQAAPTPPAMNRTGRNQTDMNQMDRNQMGMGQMNRNQAGMDRMNRNQSGMNQSGMNHSMTRARDYSDRAFLSGMLAHHQGAVDMSDELLRSSGNNIDPQVARWAQEIRQDQSEEMEDIQAMLRTVGGLDRSAYQDMKQQMDDMMSQGQGLDPSVRFVALMIPHHADAVEMALPALVYSDSRKIAHLALDIINEQSEEIVAFRDWLSQQRHSL